jgi:NAD(P)-dependent dehydrogenase (short-subunit alcohol dehydrogenase family)
MEKFGKIDILVNNAGVIVRKPTEDYGEEDWDRVINTNLKGAFNFCRAVGKHMISQRQGRIINIASIMGGVALPPRASYCASKGGLVALTKNLATEWAQHNITVNAVSPGWTLTELTADYFAQRNHDDSIRSNREAHQGSRVKYLGKEGKSHERSCFLFSN